MRIPALGVLFMLSLVVPHLARGQIAEHPSVVSNLKLIEAWLEAQMAYRGLPGVSVGVVYDQELIYSKGFGYADIESRAAAAPTTIYRIASHSKLFTAIAIMQLRDQGLLSLDDPIEKHLPWFEIRNPFGEAPAITIRHLLTHTSGLPREAGSGYWIDFDFPTIEEVRARLPAQSMVYPPETRWKYSNLALTLAGETVSVVSGQSFAEYVSENILDPLGLQSTSVVLREEHGDRLATGYGRRLPDGSRSRFPFVDARALAPAAGVSSTVEDMARFISWQFRLRESGQTEVLRAATLKEMQRVQWVQPDWKSAWGLGFEVFHTEARDLIGHSGGYPGYRTATYMSPVEEVGVIVFTNALDAEPYPGDPRSISERIFEWVAPAISRAVEGESVEPPDPSWSRLEGTYRSHWGDFHVLALDGTLALINPLLPDPKTSVLTLKPVTKTSFRLDGKGFGPLGELVVFEAGPDERSDSVRIGENRYVRVTYTPAARGARAK
jgi:CubicO group peptidase (beta-lactamase class C family)